MVGLFPGCATPHRFEVEAISQTGDGSTLEHRSFRLVDARPDAVTNDSLHAQVERDVKTALSSKGLFSAPEGVAPGMKVEVDYGISAPIVTEHTRTEPIFVPGSRASGLSDRGGSSARVVPEFYANSEVSFLVTTYQKFLRLTAWTTQPGDPRHAARQIWSVYVIANDESADLPRYVRMMVAAAMDSVGKDFQGQRRVVLSPRDRRVVFVERGMDST